MTSPPPGDDDLKRLIDEVNEGIRKFGLPVSSATSSGDETNSDPTPAGRMAESTTLETVRGYVNRGWRVVPVPRGNGKAPRIPDWPNLQITEADLRRYFGNSENIGIILGKSSGGLVDVDLDAPEAIDAAEKLLPATGMVHGRPGKPRSHRWYVADPLIPTARFQAPDGTTLCELRSTGCQTLVPPSTHPSGEAYAWVSDADPAFVDGSELLQRVQLTASAALLSRFWPREPGRRHDIALALAGFLLRCRQKAAGKCLSVSAVSTIVRTVAAIAGDEEIQDRLQAVTSTAGNIARGKPVTGAHKLEQLLGSRVVSRLLDWLDLERPEASVASVAGSSSSSAWPSPLSDEALHGLAGTVVRTIGPHTESDPAAILVQLLVAFGNIVGRGPHFTVEGDSHHTNLFSVIVGATSKARKGTSWGRVRKLLGEAEEPAWWSAERMQGGLSSGEGLIWAVRDPTDGDDNGVMDKRLFVVESEFAKPLVMMSRDGNVLSELLREAWDSGNLQILTKNSPAKATGAHISIIGHVTRDDLRRHLSTTEQANGFANRFLWVCARRSNVLPDGGTLTAEMVDPLVKSLRQAIAFARSVKEMRRDDAARELWRSVYTQLSEGRPGLLGAVISRAEAQVLRLSMIYALLDTSSVIRVEHLKAALAVWRYCEDSARYVFGDSLGDPVADKILAALREAGASGLSRTHIRDAFGRHQGASQIASALASLQEQGLARFEIKDSGGRPTELWFSTAVPAT